MNWVLDASAAISLVINKPDSLTIQEIISDARNIIVPQLYLAEIGNIFWKYHHFENLSITLCKELCQISISFADIIIPHESIIDSALAIGINNRITVYDSLYLAIAYKNSEIAGIISLDQKMNKICKKLKIQTI